MPSDCGRNCRTRGGTGVILIPGGCTSRDIPWECPSAQKCGHLAGMRENAESERRASAVAIERAWRHIWRRRHAE